MRSEAREIVDGVFLIRTLMANLFLVREGTDWVLVDAGLPGYSDRILSAVRSVVGEAVPSAIILTHGHFDHVGSLRRLLDRWSSVPVFAHRLELPYLTGRSPYPPPDPLVGGGVVPLLSRLFPRGPFDFSGRVHELAEGAGIPALGAWRSVFTPGHTSGHLSFFRERDRTLIAGDAVSTTKQESALKSLSQTPELHGPPAYFTQDWHAAEQSVGRLAAIEPETLVSGHGEPMRGADMRAALHALAARFRELEVPRFGRYAKQPAIADEQGIVSLPPDPLPKVLAAGALAAGLVIAARRR